MNLTDSSIPGDQTEELLARLGEADRLSDAGKEMEASAIYEELEHRSCHPSDIAGLQLKRAISFTNMGDLSTAEELLSSIAPDVLSDQYRLSFRFEAGESRLPEVTLKTRSWFLRRHFATLTQ
jgi:hypothetical protein